MLIRNMLLCCTLGFVLAWDSGCEERPTPLREAQRSLEESVNQLTSDPGYAGLPDREYHLARTQEALKYIEGKRSLERPYTVNAMWCFVVHPTDDGRSEIGVQWMEGDTHVVGVVLCAVGKEGRRQWRLPVFEWFQALLARPEAAPYRETAQRVALFRVLASNVEEPFLRPYKGPPDYPPIEVVLPDWVAGSDLQVGVYDDKGNVSNLVPVFIWPGEPESDQTKKP